MTRFAITTKLSDPQLMAWDTEFWGIRVGRATCLDGVGEWAVANTVGLVCLLVDANDTDEIQKAEAEGFRFMDVRVTLTVQTGPRMSWVRLARAEDTSKLKAIARTAFPLTRFYADPRLGNDRCGDLYVEWTRSLCAGAASAVLVTAVAGYLGPGPEGYVTVNVDGDHSEIGLVAVAEQSRGQHMGTKLVNGAIDWAHAHGAKHMTVVTQGRNIGALRTFEGCGFRVSNTSLWFHRWFEP